VHEERRALVRDLEGLPRERWDIPSLCPGWDVHDVLAHLVDGATTTRWTFLRDLAAARFDFDRCNAAGITRAREADPSRTLAEFSIVIDRTTTALAPLPTRLVEAIVHAEDIRRPLGISHHYPVAAVLPALQFQLKTSVGIGGGKQRAAGLRLVATDAVFESGSGPEVQGTALALLLVISGRPVEPGELNGPGAPALLAAS